MSKIKQNIIYCNPQMAHIYRIWANSSYLEMALYKTFIIIIMIIII